MARQSIESAKVVLNALMLEQARDREALQRLMSHCAKMVETLHNMREQEEDDPDAGDPMRDPGPLRAAPVEGSDFPSASRHSACHRRVLGYWRRRATITPSRIGRIVDR
jgi:hypothetical protein